MNVGLVANGGIDRKKWQRAFTKEKYAPATRPSLQSLEPRMKIRHLLRVPDKDEDLKTEDLRAIFFCS